MTIAIPFAAGTRSVHLSFKTYLKESPSHSETAISPTPHFPSENHDFSPRANILIYHGSMYIDAYSIIVQKDMDGGDSLHREGLFAFGKKLRYNHTANTLTLQNETPLRRPASEADIMDKFEVAPGIYVRHPDPKKWYSNPDTTSRDQLLPVIAYCAAYEDYPRLWRLFKATASRGFFAQNTIRIGEGETDRKLPDPMHLNIAQFIRAGGWWTAPLYPLLLVFDSIELVGTIASALPLHFQDDHLVPRVKNQNDVDDNNIVVQHLLAAVYKPTPISELSRYIYSVTRPVNFGNTQLGEQNPVMGALRWYHRSEFGGHGNPEIAELYRPLIEKYFGARPLFCMHRAGLYCGDPAIGNRKAYSSR